MKSAIRDLNTALAQKAEKELNEDLSRRDADIQHIKDWLIMQPHMNANLDDQWIVAFLRFCKFSLERTKRRIELFYTMRSTTPELSRGVDIRKIKIQGLMRAGLTICLPALGPPDAPRIVLVRAGAFDATDTPIEVFFQLGHIQACINIWTDDVSAVAGQVFVVDIANAGMDLYLLLSPTNLKKLISMGQDVLPIRIKGSHYFNAPSGTETVFKLMKLFLNEKNRNRFYVHNQVESLYDHIPREVLPTEYGGNAGPVQDLIDREAKRYEAYNDWIMDDMKHRIDESRRLGNINGGNEYGLEGSFRKINVD